MTGQIERSLSYTHHGHLFSWRWFSNDRKRNGAIHLASCPCWKLGLNK